MRILFVSNYAGRTGAPIVLLEFQRWLKARGDIRFSTIFSSGGALWSDFEKLGPVAASPFYRGARLNPAQTLLRRLVGPRRWPACAIRLGMGRRWVADAEVIHANTAVTAREILWLARFDRPVVWHIHELRHVIESEPGCVLFAEALRHCRRVVSVSAATTEFLRRELGVEEDRLDSVPEFVRVRAWARDEQQAARRAFRAHHGLRDDDVVVGGCGTLGWRKGTDLFVLIAGELARRHAETAIRLIWIGAGDEGIRRQLAHDLRFAGLEDRCQFVGEWPQASEAMPALDVLAVTSREDPYPLIMLEAAAAGVPMVGFQGAGGPDEFAQTGGGCIVPHLDVSTFAQTLVKLARNAPWRIQLGEQARAMVQAYHDVEVQAPRLLGVLQRAMARP